MNNVAIEGYTVYIALKNNRNRLSQKVFLDSRGLSTPGYKACVKLVNTGYKVFLSGH